MLFQVSGILSSVFTLVAIIVFILMHLLVFDKFPFSHELLYALITWKSCYSVMFEVMLFPLSLECERLTTGMTDMWFVLVSQLGSLASKM